MGQTSSLAERIDGVAGPAVVVLGPAACGKTTAILDLYERFGAQGKGSCLLLAPTFTGVSYLRRKLLERSDHGVVVRPRVETFGTLGGRILAAEGRTVHTLSAFRRYLLLRRLVGELRGERGLSALNSVADSPGLIDALDRVISELKRAAVEPEDLAAAVRGATGKEADLLEVYRRYQAHLHDTETYDTEGQMWLARDALATAAHDRPSPGLGGVRAILVDGFTDFTPTQLSLLALAARRVEKVVITLPWSEDRRDRLWHWTTRTRERIRAEFGDGLAELCVEPAGGGGEPAGGTALWRHVFDPDAPSLSPPTDIAVIAAAGIEAEVSAIARRVKRLLVEGAPAGSVLVTSRSMEEYGPVIDRVFAEYGIPVRSGSSTLAETPIVRFLLDVTSLAPQFLFRDVLRVIKNSYFRPSALGEFDASTVGDAEALIRNGNVFAHREAYRRAAERLAAGRSFQDSQEEASSRPSDYPRAAEMLEGLFALAAESDIGRLCEALELRQAAEGQSDPALAARDLRVLAQMEALLEDADRPSDLAPADLSRALTTVPCIPERREASVQVMDVLDARCVRALHVFLLGLGEGSFPRQWSENSLIGEAQREGWAGRGVRLDSRSDLSAREMLLFYLAASRADGTLTLSYLASDASGRAGAPGAFLESLAEPAGGIELLLVEAISPGEFLPTDGQPASVREATNTAIAGLFDSEAAAPDAALAWLARRPDRLTACVRGIWPHRRRWQIGPCDVYDGRLTDPELLSELDRRFGEEAVFSAAMLEAYGQCPWQFFARYVLRVQPLIEPERTMEAASRGLFCHEVLRETFVTLRDRRGGPVALFELEEADILDALTAAVQEASRRVERRGVAYPALWAIQRDQMREQIARYLQDHRSRTDLEPRSLHFEFAFGLEGPAAEDADEASTPDAGRVETPAGPLRLRGRIDRVDEVQWEDRAGLLVVDYKTGRLPTLKDMAEGRSLQAALYAVVAEDLLQRPAMGGAFHHVGDRPSERMFAQFKRGRNGPAANGKYKEELESALELAGRFMQAMRRGRFDCLPTHNCPSYCPYRTICQFSEARADRKGEPAEGGRKDE